MVSKKTKTELFEIVKDGVMSAIPILGEYQMYKTFENALDKDIKNSRRVGMEWAAVYGFGRILMIATGFVVPQVGPVGHAGYVAMSGAISSLNAFRTREKIDYIERGIIASS